MVESAAVVFLQLCTDRTHARTHACIHKHLCGSSIADAQKCERYTNIHAYVRTHAYNIGLCKCLGCAGARQTRAGEPEKYAALRAKPDLCIARRKLRSTSAGLWTVQVEARTLCLCVPPHSNACVCVAKSPAKPSIIAHAHVHIENGNFSSALLCAWGKIRERKICCAHKVCKMCARGQRALMRGHAPAVRRVFK